MQVLDPDELLASLLVTYEAAGGVLHYVLVEADADGAGEPIHRQAALLGMATIDVCIEEKMRRLAPSGQLLEDRFRVVWDETKARGRLVPFAEFWGTEDIKPLPFSPSGWDYPECDGYKRAFFLPPLRREVPTPRLHVDLEHAGFLFSEINHWILGEVPEENEIYSWSTDWSNYFGFDDGDRWWGAFFWTIRRRGSRRLVVIGASVAG